MYPNLYYIFKDWFGVEWPKLQFLNTFGLMVAISFIVAAIILSAELKRKEKQGLLLPREELITVGQPASFLDLFINFITGFLFGYKLLGLFLSKPDGVTAQQYIFSGEGSIFSGLLLGGILAFVRWREKDKQKLKAPEQRRVRIWPHDRVGDIIILGLIFGILGAKLFDNFEHWDAFMADPLGALFSVSGLTFYGGLILAAIAISWYAIKKGIKLKYLVDAAAPALMLAYALGRIGCQVSGDGDWGIYNSAYVTAPDAKIVVAKPGDFEKQLAKYPTYFYSEFAKDSALYKNNKDNLPVIPHTSFTAPSFLPVWMVAYNYPHNVNSDGVAIDGCTQEHCRVLPVPVFPTPFYETILCTLLFFVLWALRKRIKTPMVIFGIYLILNGIERFVVEKIRVNRLYDLPGHPSQAQIIALLIALSGAILITVQLYKAKKEENTEIE